jgi:hypothetical protein
LNEYILAVRERPFAYGNYDCCIFVAGAIEAMTGADPMAEYRGQYDSVETGKAALRTLGQGTLLKTLYRKFGKPLPGAHGRKGDIAWYNGAVGLVLGRVAMFVGAGGFVLVPLSRLTRVFRVGADG